MAIKKWHVLQGNDKAKEEFIKNYKISNFLAKILAARKYSSKEVEYILKSDGCFIDPFLLPDMEKAVERIKSAIKNQDKIVIYGDYDVDGITSTVIMTDYLKKQKADVSYYIPNRKDEGYGVNIDALKKLKSKNTKLIITVDNGIVAYEEAKFAKEQGIDLIITDHHTLRDHQLPEALAVIDPMREDYREFNKVAGVCVAFKLIAAMENGNCEKVFEDYGALVCIGTIADVMPILFENRYIVKKGLELLKNSKLPGIEALKNISSIKGEVTVKDISFSIAPRLNAATRLDATDITLNLLMSKEKNESECLAQKLEEKNQERKQLEKAILEEATAKILKSTEENRRIIVVEGENWHAGVLGIVAARLSDKFLKPCIVISKCANMAKGSGRSVEGFSLIDALNSMQDCFIKHGGHKTAVGLMMSSEKIDEFKERLETYAKNHFKLMPTVELIIDKEIETSELTINNIYDLERLKPFGQDNRIPIFLLKNFNIKRIIPLCGGKFVKIRSQKNDAVIDTLCFDMGIDDFPYRAGETIDMAVNCSVSYFGILEQLAIKIIDIRPSSFEQKQYFEDKENYENFKKNGMLEKPILRPTRDEMVIVYKYIKKYPQLNNLDLIYLKLSKFGIKYDKFRIIIDILLEFNLITCKRQITVNKQAKKCQLESSTTLHMLSKQAL